MGLLDTWNEWKKSKQGNSFGEDFSGMNSDIQSPTLNTAGGITNPSYNRNESPLIKNPIFPEKYVPPGQGKVVINPDGTNKVLPNSFNLPKNMLDQGAQQAQANAGANVPKGAMPTDPITQGGTGVKLAQDQGFLSKLSGLAGVDMKQAAANWKDKGGFDGLMSNPAFSLGLALMQSSANGKTINQGILDNFVKAGNISAEYKDRIEARAGDVTEVTSGQMDEIKNVLGTKGIDKPGWWRQILPGNQSEGYEQAVEDVAFKVQKTVSAMKRSAKASGKNIEVGKRLYKKIIDDMIASGEIKKVGGVKLGGYQVVDSTLEPKPMAKGGPVQQGKPYLVGEQGPEIIIPHSSGDVLTNDDSQIYAMLLAANPQLQKVSRVRAQKIMRNRFPEYFEG
jgi:hypothetical protein